MKTARPLLSLSLALSFGCLAACGGDDGGDSVPFGGPIVATGGAKSIPLADVDGSLTIVGTSDRFPSVNETFAGPSYPGMEGAELVRCTYYPYGDGSGTPELTILAGIEGRLYAQAQVSIFDLFDYGPYSRLIQYDEERVLRGSGLELLVTARFTQNSATDFAEYWTAFEAQPDGSTVRSRCQVDLTEFTSEWVKGTAACIDLFPSLGSNEYTGLAPSPRASATVSFDCPLVVDDGTLEPGTGGNGGTGGSDGVGGSSGGSGGSTGGTGGSSGKCVGLATPCSLLGELGCYDSLGCSLDGDCSGVSDSCYSQYSSYSCNSLDGCYWSSYYEDCSGISSSCSAMSTSYACTQQGCLWDEQCQGIPTSCDVFAIEGSCILQPGCRWE